MSEVLHVLGNGLSVGNYKQNSIGTKLTCNVCPVSVPDSYSSVMVDFRMMNALKDNQSFDVPGEWVLGARPKIFMQNNPTFYMQNAYRIKEFYTVLPKYVENYTKLSCGHMATHYGINRFLPNEVHLWGFDSIFDFDLTSFSDTLIPANRDLTNTGRLTNDWRQIWPNMFNEFKNIQFVLHYIHNNSKINLGPNVDVFIDKK